MPSLFHPEWHPLFEALGYIAGYLVFRHLRHRLGDPLPEDRRWILIAATAVGALVGSRLLGLLEQAPQAGFHWDEFLTPGGGKTIVGGLLGGWLAVEIAKRLLGIRARSGDLFALPLCVGIAVGRIGCFLAGMADDTYGTPTSLPWGVDFGDGTPRHPTQLYELLFLSALGFMLWRAGNRPHPPGRIFRVFLAFYLAWRIFIDFIKPQPLVHGLNMIQWACVVGLTAVAAGEWHGRGEAQRVQPVGQ